MTDKYGKHQININTELARERNRAAADRTLMAWIRTSLSLIAFGFSIGQFFEFLKYSQLEKNIDPIHSSRIVGVSFIVVGTLGLLAAVIQHWYILEAIKKRQYIYVPSFPLTLIVAICLLIIGLFSFIAVLL